MNTTRKHWPFPRPLSCTVNESLAKSNITLSEAFEVWKEACATPPAAVPHSAAAAQPVAFADKISFESAMRAGKGCDVWPSAGDYTQRTGRDLIALAYSATPPAAPEPLSERVARDASQVKTDALPRIAAWVQSLPNCPRDAAYWTNGMFTSDCRDAHAALTAPPAAPEPPAAEMKTLADAEISELWRQAAERDYTKTTETLVRSFARAIERALAAKNGAKT